MDPIYCPSCKKQIEPEHTVCPHCKAPVTAEGRKKLHERIVEATAEQEALRQQQEFEERQVQHAASIEARKQAIYNTATGQGVCPNCKSPNVHQYSVREGGNTAGANMACCLGCMVSPLAWILLPFMGGKKVQECQCQYCSFKWRL